jgi:hypothetical protein
MSVSKSGSAKEIQRKKVTALPEELRQLVVDTKGYKEKASSTEILRKLRYQTA